MSMAGQQGLRPNERFMLNVADATEKRKKTLQGQKKARQDDVDRLEKKALP